MELAWHVATTTLLHLVRVFSFCTQFYRLVARLPSLLGSRHEQFSLDLLVLEAIQPLSFFIILFVHLTLQFFVGDRTRKFFEQFVVLKIFFNLKNPLVYGDMGRTVFNLTQFSRLIHRKGGTSEYGQ